MCHSIRIRIHDKWNGSTLLAFGNHSHIEPYKRQRWIPNVLVFSPSGDCVCSDSYCLCVCVCVIHKPSQVALRSLNTYERNQFASSTVKKKETQLWLQTTTCVYRCAGENKKLSAHQSEDKNRIWRIALESSLSLHNFIRSAQNGNVRRTCSLQPPMYLNCGTIIVSWSYGTCYTSLCSYHV